MVGSVEKPEVELVALSELLTTPTEGECLFCYVYRMVNSHGCNGKLRWAAWWRVLFTALGGGSDGARRARSLLRLT